MQFSCALLKIVKTYIIINNHPCGSVFGAGKINSFAYEDIFDVSTNYSVVFASFTIFCRFFQDQPIVVNYLHKKEALRARRVVAGLMIAKKESIKPHLNTETDAL